MEVAEGKITLDEFVTQMTDEELAHILGGQPNTGVANTFGFGNMPEYGIPNIMTADGPAGLRIEKMRRSYDGVAVCDTFSMYLEPGCVISGWCSRCR